MEIASSRMEHLWDALSSAYDALGFVRAAGGDGAGGFGKTRTAVEICRAAEAAGWCCAGHLVAGERVIDPCRHLG